jgi:hypothetical protein
MTMSVRFSASSTERKRGSAFSFLAPSFRIAVIAALVLTLAHGGVWLLR